MFFKLEGDKIGDVTIARLDSANLLHGLHELYSVIETYIKALTNKLPIYAIVPEWIKGSARFVGIEAFRAH